jgi:hypothetical protein
MDIVEPFLETIQGNRFILVVGDYYGNLSPLQIKKKSLSRNPKIKESERALLLAYNMSSSSLSHALMRILGDMACPHP